MLKIVYGQHGPAGMSQDEFISHWREHADIALNTQDFFQHMRRYVQGDCLNHLDWSVGQERHYHGVGEVYYTNTEAQIASSETVGLKETLLPHAALFFAAAQMIRLLGDEVEWIAPQGTGGVKAFTFFRAKDAGGLDDLRQAMAAQAEELLAVAELKPLMTGYSQTVRTGECIFDAVDEISAANADDLRQIFAILEKDGVQRADQAGFAELDSRMIIIVSPNLMHDDRATFAGA